MGLSRQSVQVTANGLERDGFVTNTAYIEAFPGPFPFASASHTSD